jgi:uncharacterized membrane protein SirB2
VDWSYTAMFNWHLGLAWTSFGLFLARGLIWQIGAPWSEAISKDGRVLVLAFGINTLLIVSGISLWVNLHYDLFRTPWLLVKVIALAGYFAFGHWSMGQGRFHQAGYVMALACMGLMMLVSNSRSVF